MAVTVANNRVLMTADDDVYAPICNEPVCSITVTGAAASKSYAIFRENASGQKIFEYKTGTTPDNSFTEWMKTSTSGGLILITDDAGTDFRVFINIG